MWNSLPKLRASLVLAAGLGALSSAGAWADEGAQASAGQGEQAPAMEAAVWTPKEVQFTYMGFTSKYTCDGLRDTVREMLLHLGARKDDLKVTERFTRVSPTRVNYQFQVEDPETWDKPWGGEYDFAPLKGIVYEYACHEGNYALPSILAGARRKEQEAAAGGAKPGGQ